MNKWTGHYDSCKCMACETAAKVPDPEPPLKFDNGSEIKYVIGFDPGRSSASLPEAYQPMIEASREWYEKYLKMISPGESHIQRRAGWMQDIVDSMFISFLQKDEMIIESTPAEKPNEWHRREIEKPYCKCPRCRNEFDRLFGDHTVTEYPADGGKVVTQWSNNAEVGRSHYIDGDPMELMSDVEMLEDCLKLKYNG